VLALLSIYSSISCSLVFLIFLLFFVDANSNQPPVAQQQQKAKINAITTSGENSAKHAIAMHIDISPHLRTTGVAFFPAATTPLPLPLLLPTTTIDATEEHRPKSST
jgi:hypothetical protein